MLAQADLQNALAQALGEFGPAWKIVSECSPVNPLDPSHWAVGSQSFHVNIRHRVTGRLKVLGRRVADEPSASLHRAVAFSLVDSYVHGNSDPIRRYLEDIGVATGSERDAGHFFRRPAASATGLVSITRAELLEAQAPAIRTPAVAQPSLPAAAPSRLPRTVEAPRHMSEQPRPVVEALRPVVEAPRPAVEAPQSVVEAPRPVVEAPRPVVEAPRPVVEAPRPVVEAPRPVVEAPRLVVAAPRPAVEAPHPVVEAPPPVVESSRPVAEAPRPVVEQSRPVAAVEPPRQVLPVAALGSNVMRPSGAGGNRVLRRFKREFEIWQWRRAVGSAAQKSASARDS